VNFLRRQFLQEGDLPFTDVLTEELVAKALAAVTDWLDRIFSPQVTTLLGPEQTANEDSAALYRARRNVELDLRAIKSAMQTGELRCKTPESVRKEVWAHVLAYNLICTVMAQAAAKHDLPPRSLSFTGAMQTLEAFQPLLELGPPTTPQAACACTRNCWTPSPAIRSPTGPTVTSRD
jgi:hypothetical protein